MSVSVHFITEDGPACPLGWENSDGKALADCCLGLDDDDVLPRLERLLDLDLAPLRRVHMDVDHWPRTREQYVREYAASWWGEAEWARRRAEQRWDRRQKANRASSQPPEDLRDCIAALLGALHARPGALAELGATDEYYTAGWLQEDLSNLHRRAQWAIDAGVRWIKLFVA